MQMPSSEITLMQSTASSTLFVGKQGDQEKQSSIYPESIHHCLAIAEGLICIIFFETQHCAPQTSYGQAAETH